MTADDWIRALDLRAHPEGGFFRETYRAAGRIPGANLPPPFHGDRCFSTAIYFLLPAGGVSRLHRIASDELWHFYQGGPLRIALFAPEGGVREVLLGSNIAAGQSLQCLVPAGHWFGAWPEEGTVFSLVGCTVAPGFEFADFTLADRTAMSRRYPQARAVIERLTPA